MAESVTIDEITMSEEELDKLAYTKKRYLTPKEIAAYVLVNLPDIDFERVQQCLEKAYSIKTEGGYSEEILKALETVRKFSAMKKSQENQK